MPPVTIENRRYFVRARHLDGRHGRSLEEQSFEAAAVAYVEDLHASPAEAAELSIIVRDVESGREHCFRVDLESGEAAPCG